MPRDLLPVRRTRGRAAPPRPPRLVAACAVVLCGLPVVAALAVDRHGRVDRAVKAPAIVVLGARVEPGGLPSPTLRERAARGADLYAAGLAPLVVFSGGVGRYGPSEASVACAVAVDRGLPADRCVLEDGSHSTAENAANTARLLRERGIREVVLVTDPHHLLRARQYFWREGVRVHESPVLTAPRDALPGLRAWWTLREVLALAAHPSLLLVREPS